MRLSDTLSGQAVLLTDLIQSVLEPVLEREGIGVPTFELLNAVSSCKGQASQAQIASRLRISAPTLCEAVKTGVRQNLIAQIADPTDRRAKRLELTPKGERIRAAALSKMAEAEAALVEGIPADDIDGAVHTMVRAIRNLAVFDSAAKP